SRQRTDSSFIDEIIDNIGNAIPRHRAHIRQPKDDGYESLSPPVAVLKYNFWSNFEKLAPFFIDFLTYVKEKKTKICVVALDYAVFITNMNLLRDIFLYQNHFKAFDRRQLLNCVEDLKQFNCLPA
ncbi:hypothetical protein A0J61_09393, partial [Choanephora cucurbitarum]